MITEDYVSYEVAKLLKEKGFNEPTFTYYNNDGDLMNSCNFCGSYTLGCFNNVKDEKVNCAAPTLQMAMKWLREVHNILLFLLPAQENGKLVYLVEVWTWNEEEGIYESTYAPMPRKEPEKAIESALKYVLENLI